MLDLRLIRAKFSLHIHRLAILCLLVLIYIGFYRFHQASSIGAGYKAKVLCSNVFLTGRKAENVLTNDLNGIERLIPVEVDHENKRVRAGWSGIVLRTAVYLEPVGCVLLTDIKEDEYRKQAASWLKAASVPNTSPMQAVLMQPDRTITQNSPEPALQAVITDAFAEPFRTRALLIHHQGRLIFEQYAQGFDQNRPILGWSMTKSVLNAVIGILVGQGRLSLEQTAPITQWRHREDARSRITLEHLLRMSSGLQFDEASGEIFSDLTEMLFLQNDCGRFAAAKPLEFLPGSNWYYSSGTSNILSGIVAKAVGGSAADVTNFIRFELFYPLNMLTATIEPDSSGHLIASSFMYATAREWLRFGQLYLNNGIWNGKQILPSGWVKFSRRAAPASNGKYGAHFWINCGENCTPKSRPFPKLPGDLFYAAGYKGQRLAIIPSRQLIVVRLGWDDTFDDAAMAALLDAMLQSLN